uniref:LRRNT domain-containing protein n=1 Tax=Branchiostoma floridae TaxID=7739 RepID=C3Z971_BRAFL|eukprot:XP_002594972.1 hypothetical protein BRAFLDRAFT_103694 [Branchiostoma floridae]
MPRSKALVLLLLVSTHLHHVLAASQWCPDSCSVNQKACYCPYYGYENPCSWVGHGGARYNFRWCIDALPTGFHRETEVIDIKHLRSSVLLAWSFPNVSSLQQLKIEQSNVSTVQSGAFRGLRLVQSLYLTDNRISCLEADTFLGLDSIMTLYINKNVMTSISRYAFRGLPCISMLDLSLNLLTSVPVDALVLPKSLRATFLSKNRIATIQSHIAMELKKNRLLHVYVENNILRCNKNLTWFICNLPHLHQISTDAFPKCTYPVELRGTYLATVRKDVCQNNTDWSEGEMGDANYDDAYITSPDGKTTPMEDTSITEHTDGRPVSQHTTEMDYVTIPGGDPINKKDVSSIHTLVTISAVAAPFLLLLSSAGVLFIYKRFYRGAGLEQRGQPDGTDNDHQTTTSETETSEKIEPYAVVYADSAEMQAASVSNNPTDRQPSPSQDQTLGYSETIQPYAVTYEDDHEPDSEIQPYAVAYKEDVEQNDHYKIPLYAVSCNNPPPTAAGHVEAGPTPPEITIN